MKKIVIMIQMFVLSLFSGCNKNLELEKYLKLLEAKVYKNDKYVHPLPYRLFIPEGYSSDKKYPLVLVLHHGGARGTDNKSQVVEEARRLMDPTVQAKYPSFLFIPQCPKSSQWLNTTFKSTPFGNYEQEKIPESDAMKMVIQVIQELKQEYSIDENRIYVIGGSMGGSGTWDIITRYPDLFAAAAPLTGVSDPSKASLIAHMPIWAFHGEKDRVSSVNTTRNMVRALQEAGSNVKYTEFENQGHGITGAAFKEGLIEWLFTQSKRPSALSELPFHQSESSKE